MIVFDGFKLIGLAILVVMLLIFGFGYLVLLIREWDRRRKDRKNQEWWDKREGEEREGEEE